MKKPKPKSFLRPLLNLELLTPQQISAACKEPPSEQFRAVCQLIDAALENIIIRQSGLQKTDQERAELSGAACALWDLREEIEGRLPSDG